MAEFETEYKDHWNGLAKSVEFPCVFGQRAIREGKYTLLSEHQMNSPVAAGQICEAIYHYLPHAIAVVENIVDLKSFDVVTFGVQFPDTLIKSEDEAARALFTLMVNMHQYDKAKGKLWSASNSNDPRNKDFAFSIGSTGFFLPFFYPGAYARQRQYPMPLLLFNLDAIFAHMKLVQTNRQRVLPDGSNERMSLFHSGQEVIRGRLEKYHGGVHPFLADAGSDLALPQYLLPDPNNLDRMWEILAEIGGDKPFG
jgi:FPC/CPF motif-containing protein YcgG